MLVVGFTAVVTGLTAACVAHRAGHQLPEQRKLLLLAGRASHAAEAAYPTGVVRTGAPIFLDAIRRLKVSFARSSAPPSPDDVRGKIVLRGSSSSTKARPGDTCTASDGRSRSPVIARRSALASTSATSPTRSSGWPRVAERPTPPTTSNSFRSCA